MLRPSDLYELQQGQTVYLTAHTKTASRACWEKRAVKVMHGSDTLKRHWPLVVVEWEQGGAMVWEKVHYYNINLRSTAVASTTDKREGDGAGSAARKPSRVRVMPGKIKPIQLADGEEQGALF